MLIHSEMLARARKWVDVNVDRAVLDSFSLGNDEQRESIHVVPLSGGKDSSVLAILLKALYPEVRFVYVFTDTGAEPEAIYQNLSLLERYLDTTIVRLKHPLGLFGRIEKYNGYLPSQQNRWCTAELKIKVIDRWFKDEFDYATQKVFTYVGFAFDEDRIGMISDDDEVESRYPFISLKIDTQKVFSLLDETIGINDLYRTKSRSGCFCCPFLRRYEKVMMLFERPHEFQTSKRYEKLDGLEKARCKAAGYEGIFNALYSTDAMSLRGPQEYFIPKAVDARTDFLSHMLEPKTKRLKDKVANARHKDQMSIFDLPDVDDDEQEGYLYVAVGYWVSTTARDYFADFSYSGNYLTEFATYSRDLAGLKRSLHFWCEHKLGVAPLYGLTKERLREQLKVGLFQIKVPKAILEVLQDVSSDSYTWAKGECYEQIETVVRLAHTVLTYEGWEQFWADQYSHLSKYSKEELWLMNSYAYSIREMMAEYRDVYKSLNSSIEWSGVFNMPSQESIDEHYMSSMRSKEGSEDRNSAAMACAICSI